jgi:TetR/AcrR family transcriptional repressor of nem operon
MSRTREFDRDAALDQALKLFWEQGYEATSVRDLIAQLGISSSSLYATFGDKQALYLAALTRYREQEYAEMAALLAGAPTARVAMTRLFDSLADTLLNEDGARGTFTLNAAIERGAADPQVSGQLIEHFENLTALLTRRLRQAQRHGEITADHVADDLARFFLHTLYGLATFAVIAPDRARLERVARVALTVLD